MKKFYVWFTRDNRFWTSKGLITRALVGVVAYIVFSLLGLRQYTAILSGTSPSGHSINNTDIMFMGIYVFSYLYVTVISPIFCIAAGLLYCKIRLTSKKVE